MKKFYKLVSVKETGDGFVIQLDGKPVQTPGQRAPLVAPGQELAQAIADEWMRQEEKIDPETMPLTQILTTAQDHIVQEREQITAKLLQYLDTDLICYRTTQPEDLAAQQANCWDEWLAWFEKTYGAALQITADLQALEQPAAAKQQVAESLATLDDMRFCACQLVTVLSGSLVLGLAFTAKQAAPEQVYEAANIEESYKAKIYNEAEHGAAPLQEKKQKAMRRDLEAARKFLDLL